MPLFSRFSYFNWADLMVKCDQASFPHFIHLSVLNTYNGIRIIDNITSISLTVLDDSSRCITFFSIHVPWLQINVVLYKVPKQFSVLAASYQ